MSIKNKLKEVLTGLCISQEYICVGLKNFQNPLSALLEIENQKTLLDVTSLHLFLGYKPLIIGLPFEVNDQNYRVVAEQNQVSLNFENAGTQVAKLILKKIGQKTVGGEVVLFYEGEHGTHSFLNPVHQWINRQREKWKRENPNNVGLPGNLADQVRIAYSIPRIISVITASDGNLVNLFPTDLHGTVGERFYASSLRRGGKANEQVEKYGRVVISEVDASFFKQAYSLGKNHMQELQSEAKFQLHSGRSMSFNFPLPKAVMYYKELKWIDSFDWGIHRIHLYEIIHQQDVDENKSTLAHIHRYYAQWRINAKLKTNYLFR